MKYLKISEKIVPYDFEYKGLKCAIRGSGFNVYLSRKTLKPHRGRFPVSDEPLFIQMPVLNGYVGIPKEHPFFKTDYRHVHGINVHGGLTFAHNFCPPTTGFVPLKRPNFWWFGFDTNHYMDWEVYKDENYVYDEVIRLAKQLYKTKPGPKNELYKNKRNKKTGSLY